MTRDEVAARLGAELLRRGIVTQHIGRQVPNLVWEVADGE